MSSARVRNNSLCKLDNETSGIDWPYCISFQMWPLFNLRWFAVWFIAHCTALHFRWKYIVDLSWLSSLSLLDSLAGQWIFACTHTHQGSPFICGSCPLHTVWKKKSSINTSLPSRGLTQSPTTFCSSYFVVSSGVKPLCLRLLSPVSLQCAAGLMAHSPAGPLLRYGYCFSGFTASANASGLLKYG